ncbi:hypothetical protein PIB30_043328 [Stylosanthes scabra]|uniref:Uncharacterized protein n=1 Tax=Stylosanthes scabra TaxID=79078 RepID=A0ABU6THJ5_9FABA|nr:hypothetical protein [Stylosanthes scabra]
MLLPPSSHPPSPHPLSALPLSRRPTIGAHSERQTSSSIVGALSQPFGVTSVTAPSSSHPLSSRHPSSSVSLLPFRWMQYKLVEARRLLQNWS